MTAPRILFSGHARDRMEERDPEFARLGISVAVAEIREAIEAGRIAKTKPRWASAGIRKKLTDGRYVWDEGCTRCYVVTPGHHRAKWVVVTFYGRASAAWNERAQLKAAP